MVTGNGQYSSGMMSDGTSCPYVTYLVLHGQRTKSRAYACESLQRSIRTAVGRARNGYPRQGWVFDPFYALPSEMQPGTLPASPLTFLAQLIAVVAGVIFHIIVTTAKRFQAQPDRPPILALGTFPLIINAKIGQILFRLLLTLVGFFALVFAYSADEVTLLNAFLVGYSLDSVVDLFGANAEQRATGHIPTLRRQLGITPSQ